MGGAYPLYAFFKETFKHFTGPAFFHFVFPGIMRLTTALGAVDEPAKIAGFKLICRAFFLPFVRTI